MTEKITLATIIFCISLFLILLPTIGYSIPALPEYSKSMGLIILISIPMFAGLFYYILAEDYTVNEEPLLPFKYIFVSSVASIFVVCIAYLIDAIFAFNAFYLLLICWIIWFVVVSMPFAYYPFYVDKISKFEQGVTLDREVIGVAKKYGGIIPIVLVWELNISLDESRRILEKFCRLGEAQRKNIGSITIYDFPSTRVYLARSDTQIIELLRDNPRGLTRSNLLQLTNMSIDALDESLKRLESKGMIRYVMEIDAYVLKGITHLTNE